jgi:hypothetical protein
MEEDAPRSRKERKDIPDVSRSRREREDVPDIPRSRREKRFIMRTIICPKCDGDGKIRVKEEIP